MMRKQQHVTSSPFEELLPNIHLCRIPFSLHACGLALRHIEVPIGNSTLALSASAFFGYDLKKI